MAAIMPVHKKYKEFDRKVWAIFAKQQRNVTVCDDVQNRFSV